MPQGLRTRVGLWLELKSTRSKWLALAYYYLFYDAVVRFIPEGNCSVAFQGSEITMPRETLGIFLRSLYTVYTSSFQDQRGAISS